MMSHRQSLNVKGNLHRALSTQYGTADVIFPMAPCRRKLQKTSRPDVPPAGGACDFVLPGAENKTSWTARLTDIITIARRPFSKEKDELPRRSNLGTYAFYSCYPDAHGCVQDVGPSFLLHLLIQLACGARATHNQVQHGGCSEYVARVTRRPARVVQNDSGVHPHHSATVRPVHHTQAYHRRSITCQFAGYLCQFQEVAQNVLLQRRATMPVPEVRITTISASGMPYM